MPHGELVLDLTTDSPPEGSWVLQGELITLEPDLHLDIFSPGPTFRQPKSASTPTGARPKKGTGRPRGNRRYSKSHGQFAHGEPSPKVSPSPATISRARSQRARSAKSHIQRPDGLLAQGTTQSVQANAQQVLVQTPQVSTRSAATMNLFAQRPFGPGLDRTLARMAVQVSPKFEFVAAHLSWLIILIFHQRL